LQLLAHIARTRSFSLGDLGQRIFQQPFSWLALGVDVQGRSQNLRINYRTSHQIRTQADRLLGHGSVRCRWKHRAARRYNLVFNVPQPDIHALSSQKDEATSRRRVDFIRAKEGIAPP